MDKKLYTPDEDKMILTLRKNNTTIDEICKRINRTKPSVSYRVYRILDKLDAIEKSKILGIVVPKVEEKKIIIPQVTKKIVVIQEQEDDDDDDLPDDNEIEKIEEEVEKTEDEEEEKIEEVEEPEENHQYFFKEIYLPPAELDKLSLNLNPKHTEQELRYLEQLKSLQGRLIARVFELIEIHMTEHQKKIVVLMLKNKTYNSMAVLLNINYTAIAHAIKGIKTKKHGKYHGGIERKLRKICMRDDCCLDLLEQISDTRQELLLAMEDNSEVLVEGY